MLVFISFEEKWILVVGVTNPGLAGEVTLPGTLANFFLGWQESYWGSLCVSFFFNFCNPIKWLFDKIVLQCRKQGRAESLKLRPRF